MGMPIVRKPGHGLSPQQKKLAENISLGMSYRDAYAEAGYSGKFPYSKSSNSVVYTPEFKHYLFHLREQTAERTHQSVDLLIKQLDDARLLAMVERQVPAAVQAIMAKAKLLGYLVDKAELELHILNKPSREPIDVTELTVDEWQEQFGVRPALEASNDPFS